jgi:zinc resistance-associated protein
MSSRMRSVLLVSALLGAASMVGAAEAQQSAPPAGAPQTSPPEGARPPGPPPSGFDAPQRPGMMRLGRLAALPPGDRAAVIDARLGGLRAGLELTADQAKLWPPVETAIRDSLTQMLDLRQKYATAGQPRDPMERLARASDALSARAAALQKLTSAAQPLYASLDPEQKRRIPMLLGAVGGIGGRSGPTAGAPGARSQQNAEQRGPQRNAEQRGPRGRAGRNDYDERAQAQQPDRDQRPNWRQRMRERMNQMASRRDEWRDGSLRGGRGGSGFDRGNRRDESDSPDDSSED